MWQKYSGSERRTPLYSFVPVITAGSTASSAGGDTGSLSGMCQFFFLERAVQALRIHPAGESDCPTARRAYYRREQMVLRLGFTSLMKLKVLMAGFVG
ncbi:hypothetical protein [Escherichia albertii]|uniref:hypothetical protein n=1 Tax=Escherichia albertii TaxID=208962 RepID=UPI00201DEF59|nr:hypothetical protein [Escherichia albertii]